MGNVGAMKFLFDKMFQEIISSVSETESQTFLTAVNELNTSHSGREPKVYKRTGQLKNSPRTTGVIVSGNTVIAKIYLDQQYNYDTGTYSTPKVFSEAEAGGSGIVVTPGFWKRTESKVPIYLSKAFSKRF